jgi:lysozyme
MTRALLLATLTLSATLALDTSSVDAIAQWEGFRATPYRCTAGHLTIGYGSRCDLHPGLGNRVTEAEARAALVADLTTLEVQAQASHPGYCGWTVERKTAVLSMYYQLGPTGWAKFRNTRALIDAGDWQAASTEALRSEWARQTPVRAAEVAAMMKGTP